MADAEKIYRRSLGVAASTKTESELRGVPSLFANHALTLWLLGYPDQACAKIDEALNLSSKLAEPWQSAIVFFFATLLYRHMREAQWVHALAERMLTLHAQYDIKNNLLEDELIHGWLLAQQGYFEEGIAHMRAGIDGLKALNHAMFQTHRLGLLVEAQLNAGQLEAAYATLEEAFAIAEHSGQRSWDADLYRLKGDLLCAAEANASAALICYEQAIAIARQQSAKSLELRATLRLGQLLQRQGKQSEARQHLTAIYAWFNEGFDTADLKEAQMLLDGICT